MAVTSTDLLVIERGGTLYKAPVSELPSGGGGGAAGLTLLQKETITTSVAAVDFDLPSGYTNFKLVSNDIGVVSGSSQGLWMRISTDGGSTFLSSAYKGFGYMAEYGFSQSTSPNYAALPGFVMIPSAGGASPDNLSGAWDVAVSPTYCDIRGMFSQSTRTGYTLGRRITTALPDAIRLYTGSGNMDAGSISLYGYKGSV